MYRLEFNIQLFAHKKGGGSTKNGYTQGNITAEKWDINNLRFDFGDGLVATVQDGKQDGNDVKIVHVGIQLTDEQKEELKGENKDDNEDLEDDEDWEIRICPYCGFKTFVCI